MNYLDELERSVHADIEKAKELILTPLPELKYELTGEELETELLKLSAMHYICARLRSRGKSIREVAASIKQDYGYVLTEYQISHMVNKVLNINYRMMPRCAELLRQQIDEQLDSLMADTYSSAAEEGRDYLKPQEVKVILGIIDRRVKLYGLDAPQQINVNVGEEIRTIQDDLYRRLEGITRAKVGNYIDVGNKDESKQ